MSGSPVLSDGCSNSISQQGYQCVTITNYTDETLKLELGGKPLQNIKTIDSNKFQEYTVSAAKLTSINVVGVTSNHTYATLSPGLSSMSIYPQQSERAPLKKSKQSILLAGAVIGVVVVIICVIFIHKTKQRGLKEFCVQKNLQGEECAQEIALEYKAPDGYSSTGLVFAAVVGGILFIGCLVLWVIAFGPLRYASLSDCKSRDGWGTLWFWVKPQSKFRQFLCSTFGACECASDSLRNACNVLNRTESGSYSWNEKAIAKMHSTTNCQCCTGRGCVNPLDASNECTRAPAINNDSEERSSELSF